MSTKTFIINYLDPRKCASSEPEPRQQPGSITIRAKTHEFTMTVLETAYATHQRICRLLPYLSPIACCKLPECACLSTDFGLCCYRKSTTTVFREKYEGSCAGGGESRYTWLR